MAFPVTVSFIANLVFLEESPRYLMIKGDFEEGYRILKRIAKVSNADSVVVKLDNEEIK